MITTTLPIGRVIEHQTQNLVGQLSQILASPVPSLPSTMGRISGEQLAKTTEHPRPSEGLEPLP